MQDISETSDTNSELTAAPGEPLAGPQPRSENGKWTVGDRGLMPGPWRGGGDAADIPFRKVRTTGFGAN
ncbi:hypothetical protein [Mesorhizobium album]|nr:hypothetical protein [Mesorhizobium sp. VK24D]